MPEDDEKDREIARLNNDLSNLREKLRTTEARAAAVESVNKDHEAKLARATEAAKEEGLRQGRAETATEHSKALASVELRALGTRRRLIEPDDAPLYIDVGTVMKDGKFDPEAAGKAFDDLESRKAHVFTPEGGAPPPPGTKGNGHRPAGRADQGPRPLGAADPDTQFSDAMRAAASRR